MQLIISQPEIETAIRDYVANMFVLQEGVSISIEMRATRGETGISAAIDLEMPGRATASKPAPAPKPQVTQPTKVAAGSAEQMVKERLAPTPAPVTAPVSETNGRTTMEDLKRQQAAEAAAEEAITSEGKEETGEQDALNQAPDVDTTPYAGVDPSEIPASDEEQDEPRTQAQAEAVSQGTEDQPAAAKPAGRSLFKGLRQG